MKRHSYMTVVILLAILVPAVGIRADDTEIYGVVSNPSIPPNVSIIFDTSGSMATEDVPGEPYLSTTTYSGSYTTNAVYQRIWDGHRYLWTLFTNSINNIACDAIKTELLSTGNAVGKIRASNTATTAIPPWERERPSTNRTSSPTPSAFESKTSCFTARLSTVGPSH